MAAISEPGIYTSVASADYFRDPAPSPSLNQSIAKVLLTRTPKHAWLAHPRLNPAYEHTEDTKFNIGNAAHKILIGRGKEITIVDADDWRTKAAKDARDEAHAAGHVAVLRHQFDTASDMTIAALQQLAAIPECEGAFSAGNGEVVVIARDGDIWLRTMIDWLRDTTRLFDYKTTSASAHPDDIAYRMTDGEWPIQAAMQERCLDLTEPATAGRRKHYFVCQETAEPYALTVSEMTEATMTIGRLKLARAIETWRACTASGRWPMYGTGVLQPSYPTYAVQKMMEQMAGEAA